MKKFFLAFLCLAFFACENPSKVEPKKDPGTDLVIKKETGENLVVSADIALPEDSLVANESVELAPIIRFAQEVDTTKVNYTWSISEGGLPISLEKAADKILKWLPTKPGRYSASLTVEYEGRKVHIIIVVVIYGGTDDSSKLAWFQKGIIGKWHGKTTTPWVEPYTIEMEFRKDGSYSSRTVEGMNQPALYYGTDHDSDLKRFSLDDVKANGDASGEIQVYFTGGTTTLDELRHVRLSEDKTRLSFDLWHFGHGPVQVELIRTP